jgi:hypothetical protein
MAKNNVKLHFNPYNSLPTVKVKVQDRTNSSDTVIYPGEPVKILADEGGNYAGHLATGDPELGTDIVLGIAKSQSTETDTADGEVEVYLPLPGVIWSCAAHTPTNLATGILLDCVTFDLANGVYTVDENEGSDEDVHGLRIMDYNTETGEVYFTFKNEVTLFGTSV